MNAPSFKASDRHWGSLNKFANTVRTKIEPDVSGKKTYRINSIGFRGQDYNPEATRDIFAFGCSVTFGVGLNEDELWCRHFHENYAALHGLTRTEVNLMNFGLGGGSNPEIARTVILQCSAKAPDLALVQFSFPERFEMAHENEVMSLGPWCVDQEWLPPHYRDSASDYYLHYTSAHGGLELLKSILMVQYFFQAKQIDYMIGMVAGPGTLTSPIKALLKLTDRRRMVWLSSVATRLARQGTPIDWTEKAADDQHPGPRMHLAFASEGWKRYRGCAVPVC